MRLNYFENIAVIVNTLQVICQDVWDGFLIVDPRDNVFITNLLHVVSAESECSLIV